MAMTRDFRETIWDRIRKDPDFRQGLLREAQDLICRGDIGTGCSILHVYFDTGVAQDLK
jgi:hypothetical protein